MVNYLERVLEALEAVLQDQQECDAVVQAIKTPGRVWKIQQGLGPTGEELAALGLSEADSISEKGTLPSMAEAGKEGTSSSLEQAAIGRGNPTASSQKGTSQKTPDFLRLAGGGKPGYAGGVSLLRQGPTGTGAAWLEARLQRTGQAAFYRPAPPTVDGAVPRAYPLPGVDPAALDLAFQRDARRYDGAFQLL